MNEHPLQATIMDVVPLGPRLLLSVRGLGSRPVLPAGGLIVQTGERMQLLGQPQSNTTWLLSEVTLLAEASGEVDWRSWRGKVLEIVQLDGQSSALVRWA